MLIVRPSAGSKEVSSITFDSLIGILKRESISELSLIAELESFLLMRRLASHLAAMSLQLSPKKSHSWKSENRNSPPLKKDMNT